MTAASAWAVAPHPRLGRPVASVAGSRDGAATSAPVRVVPNGLADLFVSAPLDAPTELVELALYGLKTRARTVLSPTRVANVSVRIRAAHVGALFGVDAAELIDHAVPLRDLWGPAVDRLADDLARAPGFEARKAVLERALLARITALDDSGARLAGAAAHAIEDRRGLIRVAELARHLGCGERRLLRTFRRHVGLSPKSYAGVVRFREAWGDLARGDPQARVAAQRGYSDQAHLLREFRRFAGARPSAVGFVQSRALSPE